MENDMHETLFEVTSGPLILLNAYLAINRKDTTIGVVFFMLIFGCYLLLSRRAFDSRKQEDAGIRIQI